jgi:low temperature requirement protein LtrA
MLRPPTLRTLDSEVEPRRASWLELFFDLVFVVGVAELAQELVRDHDPGGFAIFAGLFLVVFVAWQGFSFYADRFDTDDVLFRLVMLTAMLAIAALAVQIPDVAHGERTTGFVVAFVILRSLVVGLYLRAFRNVPAARPLTARYAGGYSISIVLWLASLTVAPPGRYVLWGVGLAIDYLMPVIAQPLHRQIPIDPRHVRERFALFTLIVLGESVVAVALGVAGQDWRTSSALTAALGFVAVAALWWLYFGFGVEGGFGQRPGGAQLFTRVHIALLGALTAGGAGVRLLIEEAPSGGLETGAAWALAGGAALALACLCVTQSLAERPPSRLALRRRLMGAALLLAVAALAGALSPLALAAIVATVLAALVAGEVIEEAAAG